MTLFLLLTALITIDYDRMEAQQADMQATQAQQVVATKPEEI